jgi:hypothetical protein
VRGDIGLYLRALDWLAMTGSGWWAGCCGGGNGAVGQMPDWLGGRGEIMAVPNGAKDGVVNGSGSRSMLVDRARRGKSGMFMRYSQSAGQTRAASRVETHLMKESAKMTEIRPELTLLWS